MSKFLRELLIGMAIILAGIYISVNSGQYIFFGLIVAGLFSVTLAFVHLFQSKRGVGSVKKMYPTDKPKEKVSFLQNLELEANLDVPKQISITCSRKDQAGSVFLNGEQVGTVAPDTPLVFTVTKRNNVVNISEQYEGICFFHVTDMNGIGALKVGIGMQSAAVRILRDTGLAEGIETDEGAAVR